MPGPSCRGSWRRMLCLGKELAAAMGTDPSALSKILNGRRRCTPKFLQAARRGIEVLARGPRSRQRPIEAPTAACAGHSPAFRAAIEYRRQGWSVIPQRPSTKRAYVKWKEFQDRRPSEGELRQWWQAFPDAGIAVICGPLSGIVVIDVDGPEAGVVLISRVGSEPCGRKPSRVVAIPAGFTSSRHPEFSNLCQSDALARETGISRTQGAGRTSPVSAQIGKLVPLGTGPIDRRCCHSRVAA